MTNTSMRQPGAILQSAALIPPPGGVDSYFLNMTATKMYLLQLLAAAAAMSDSEEWRAFGGLVVGSLFSGLAGVGILLLPGKPMPRQVVIARMTVNAVFGIGLGSFFLLLLAEHAGVVVGPLMSVGTAFILGVLGVVILRVFEPRFERWLENRADTLLPDSKTSRKSPPPDNQ